MQIVHVVSFLCDRVLVLSPHRDDAAFSTGLLLHACALSGLQAAVLNVFTRSEYAPYCEPQGVDAISSVREQEDVAFFGSLPGPVVFGDLGLLDAPLRRKIAVEEVLSSSLSDAHFQADVEALEQWLGVLPEFDLLLAPLGLGGHLDHAVTREAARRRVPVDRLGFYADLPYAMRGEPIEVPPGLYECRLQIPDGIARKTRMAGFYPSQICEDLSREIGAAGALGEQLLLPVSLIEPTRRALEGHATLC